MPIGAVGFNWDRNALSSWNELIQYLPQELNIFWRGVDYLRQWDQELNAVLTTEAESRYRTLFDVFHKQLYAVNDGNSVPIVQWILLGSLLEATMQIFLQIYLHDYNKSTWHQWVGFDRSTVQDHLHKFLLKSKEEGIITKDQKDALKEAIDDKIKEHTKKQKIPQMMLNELIQFYSDEQILIGNNAKADIEMMRTIQKNRNSIHLILDRDISDWDELREAVHFYGCLLNEFVSRFPGDFNMEVYR